jgi:hypothetical protein
MKYLCLSFSLLLVACTQLMQGQQQPVKLIDSKNNTYFTSCSGAVEDWGSCAQKAKQTCPNGYNVIKRYESAVGGKRELTFECK